ncbi:MAG: hypothetical protein M3R01_06450, partial [Actinomycetota bacterium]|nr:hypothetical protein [Actinomycetota bacterium]
LEAVRHRLELVPTPLIGCVFARTDGGHVTTAYTASPALPEHLAPGRRTRGGRRARGRRDEPAIILDNGSGVSSANGHATTVERAARQHGDDPGP